MLLEVETTRIHDFGERMRSWCIMVTMMACDDVVACLQNQDMEEFSRKYDETVALLQNALSRLSEHLRLSSDEWRQLSDGEKSTYCPAEPAETQPSPTAEDAEESRTASDEKTYDVVDQRRSCGKDSGATPSSEGDCDVEDEDVDDASKDKTWNCYTVFVKQNFEDVHVTRV